MVLTLVSHDHVLLTVSLESQVNYENILTRLYLVTDCNILICSIIVTYAGSHNAPTWQSLPRATGNIMCIVWPRVINQVFALHLEKVQRERTKWNPISNDLYSQHVNLLWWLCAQSVGRTKSQGWEYLENMRLISAWVYIVQCSEYQGRRCRESLLQCDSYDNVLTW